MVNDPIGDLIARIKNAASRGRTKLTTPASKMRARVLDVLTEEGYIRGYHLVEKPGAFPEFEIELKYFDGQPVIVEISRVSKPGRRVYSSAASDVYKRQLTGRGGQDGRCDAEVNICSRDCEQAPPHRYS